MKNRYVIGLDFGTLSCRAIIVDISSGRTHGVGVSKYEYGIISNDTTRFDINLTSDWALQVPQNYLDSMVESISIAIKKSDINPMDIVAIANDFTSCTIIPTDCNFEPLDKKFPNNPHAYAKLWAHHAAQKQSEYITSVLGEYDSERLSRYGGIISSEWFLPKVLQIIEEDKELYDNASLFIEAGDWINAQLTGILKRNKCQAGFKNLWIDDNLISDEILVKINPSLENYHEKTGNNYVNPGDFIGKITKEWAEKLNLSESVIIGAGLIDAHSGMLGVGKINPTELLLTVGTSTCHLLLSKKESIVKGISGVVKDGIVPGFYSYEAGQSSVGDTFAWFVDNLIPSKYFRNAELEGVSIHDYLSELASKYSIGESKLVALDWFRGNRTPYVNSNLSGAIIGLTSSTKPEEIYRSLLEATAFGTKLIVDTFEKQGQPISKLNICGGNAINNKLMMQIYADVTNLELHISSSDYAPALGSAVLAAASLGEETIQEVCAKITAPSKEIIYPNKENHLRYLKIYNFYCELSEYFATKAEVMTNL